MPDKHEHDCDKIAKLEARVASLEKLIASVGLAAEGVTFRDKDTTITISAVGGGIWVEGKDKTIACLYSIPREGAVVGIYGKPGSDGTRRSAMDAALAYDSKSGATLQLMTPDNRVHHLTPEETGDGVQLTTRRMKA